MSVQENCTPSVIFADWSAAEAAGEIAAAAARTQAQHAAERPRLTLPFAAMPPAYLATVYSNLDLGRRGLARDIAATAAYATSRRERKKVELLFAHLKRILRLDRLRLRGST